ncbi:MAG TPA: APC family permease, partial [Actinomycetes bacterium]|nr:APC family permease [Actinomycetes bacterium]
MRASTGVKLGVLSLAMINVAAIVSARNLPVMAEYGWSMLALFAISILVFLVPIAMVAAELGTAWCKEGGVFAWVKEAFGGRTGFLAVWCDYAENIAWFPTVLSFIAATFAYVFDPALATNKLYLVVVMLGFFWGATLLTLPGVRASSAIGSIGTIAGSILPAVLVVVLGAVYLVQGNPSQIPFSREALIPDIQLNNLAFLGGIILLFTGMEMAGFHARETRNPGRDVPRAILLGVGIIVAFSVLGSLFLAFVLPQKEISLVSGVMELFQSILSTLNIEWLLRPLALVIALGGVAHLMPWILGPAKGLAEVARQGYAPQRLGRVNTADVPVALLVAQGLGGSLFALLFLFVPDVSTSYWMLSAVTAQV